MAAEMVTEPPLVLVKVTVWEALVLLTNVRPKERLVGETLMAVVPVPCNSSVSGELGSLLVTAMAADSTPTREGVKVTLTVQVPRTAMVPGQAFDWAKSAPLVPVGLATTTEVQEAVPLLVRVKGEEAEVAPRVVLGKVSRDGARLMEQAVETVALASLELGLVPALLKAFTR